MIKSDRVVHCRFCGTAISEARASKYAAFSEYSGWTNPTDLFYIPVYVCGECDKQLSELDD